MKICTNCGQEVSDNAKYCMSCGKVINNNYQSNIKEIKTEKGKMISTLTVVFGVMGFWPFIIIGSIIGIILYIISLNYEDNEYKERARIGFALSLGSLLLYITA